MIKAHSAKFTSGNILPKMIAFILPLMASNVLQQLYNAADLIIAGFSSNPDAVGSIGMTASLTHLLVNLFVGSAVGANVVISRHLGAGENDKAGRAAHTAVLISFIFGLCCSVLGLIISEPVLKLMGAEGNLLKYATLYTRIFFLGVPFTALTNFMVATLHANGDTRSPLIILSLAGLFNVLLNSFFVFVLDMSVDGVAIATALANVCSAIALFIRLSKENGPCKLSFKTLKMDKREFIDILKTGMPAGIQMSLFSLSNILIQSSIISVNNALTPAGSAYEPIVKGNAAANSLDGICYTALASIHVSAVTFTSQNVGANDYQRVKKVAVYGYMLGIIGSIILGVIMLTLKAPLLSLYGVVDGPEGSLERLAYNAGTTRINIFFFTYATAGLLEIGAGLNKGMGRAGSSAAITFVGTCLFRIAWLLTAFASIPTLNVIYYSYPISWTITGIAQLILYVTVYKKRKNTQNPTI